MLFFMKPVKCSLHVTVYRLLARLDASCYSMYSTGCMLKVYSFALKGLILPFFLFFLNRYASLYFCCCIEKEDNELLTLEIIHRYVELLDKYFGNVSRQLGSGRQACVLTSMCLAVEIIDALL